MECGTPGLARGAVIVPLQRQRGLCHRKGVTLEPAHLPPIVRAFRHWSRVRDEWAAFDTRFSGIAASWYYTAPGRDSEQVRVGGSCMGHADGRIFKGKTERRPLVKDTRVADGVVRVADLWHAEKFIGCRDGEKVGEAWAIAGGEIEFEAERFDAFVRRDCASVALEPWDEDFLVELAHVVGALDA
jgi:hypothetical protein